MLAQSLFQNLIQEKKLTEGLYLFLFTCLCFSLSVFRVFYTETNTFLFLNWNLFLAFVPWALSSLVTISPILKKSKLVITFLLFSWLLFFPNAPYILTDLFHLRLNSAMPKWYDLMMILSFAWTGLLFGLFSLFDIEKIMLQNFSSRMVHFLSSFLLFVTAFGIYLGRYLRWNSWDILSNPIGLISDISSRFLQPFEHPRTWGVTILMGIFLNMIYWSFKFVKQNRV